MPAVLDISFGDLAKVALSSTELNETQLAILHSLIQLLLKKLNCGDEMVTLSGYEAQCFEEELKQTKIPPIAFDDANMVLFADRFTQLDELEKRAKDIEGKLEKHMNEIEITKKVKPSDLSWENWDVYKSCCENLCTICAPENDLACELLKNPDFLKQMCRRISEPIVARLFDLEKRVETFNDELDVFLKRAADHYEKIALLEECIRKLDAVEDMLKARDAEFLSTMEEIQDMLDCKLDKIHLPVLKRYLAKRLNELEATLQKLEQQEKCPQAAGIIMRGIQCVSCQSANVCARVGVTPTGMLPELKRPKKKYKKKFCGCEGYSEDRAEGKPARAAQQVPVLNAVKKPSRRCKSKPTDVEYVEGSNGTLYRKG